MFGFAPHLRRKLGMPYTMQHEREVGGSVRINSHSAAMRAVLVTALSAVLISVSTEEAAFQERVARGVGRVALGEQLASVATSLEVLESENKIWSEAQWKARPLPRTMDLADPAEPNSKKTSRLAPAPKDQTPSDLAEKGGRVVAAETNLRMRLTATGTAERQGASRSGLLRLGLAIGDKEMRTALPGPQTTEGRIATAMRFRARRPEIQVPQDGKETSASLASRFAGIALDTGAEKQGKDELLTFAYAPAEAAQPKYSLFDHILKEEPKVFVPPLGPKDHSWAATPLPVSAFSKKEQTCLATGIYFEARGESETGQAAVAQVILNRARNPAYPNTICGVVYQNQTWKNRCQFSFACDGITDRVTDRRAYAAAERIAHEVTSGETWLPEVGSATSYHATYVNPRWAKAMERVDRIGRHIFYRTFNGGWD